MEPDVVIEPLREALVHVPRANIETVKSLDCPGVQGARDEVGIDLCAALVAR